MILVDKPNRVLEGEGSCCYISFFLKPRLYTARVLPERNVPCSEIFRFSSYFSFKAISCVKKETNKQTENKKEKKKKKKTSSPRYTPFTSLHKAFLYLVTFPDFIYIRI